MPQKRIFVVIPLPASLRHFLAETCRTLELPGKITPAENLHITVHFIGSAGETDIPEFVEKIDSVARKTDPFRLEFNEIIYKKGYNRMLWAAIKASQPFTDLALTVREVLSGEKDKSIKPHITLSRIKERVPANVRDRFPVRLEPHFIEADRTELWQSRTGGKFPVYSCLHQFPFSSSR